MEMPDLILVYTGTPLVYLVCTSINCRCILCILLVGCIYITHKLLGAAARIANINKLNIKLILLN